MAGEVDGTAMPVPHESKDMCMSVEHILDYTPTSGSLYQTVNNDSGTVFWLKNMKTKTIKKTKRYCKFYCNWQYYN